MFLFGLFVIRREFKEQTEAKEKKENSQILSSRTLLNWREILGKSKYIFIYFFYTHAYPALKLGKISQAFTLSEQTTSQHQNLIPKVWRTVIAFSGGNCQWQRRRQSDTVWKMSVPSCFCALFYVTLPLLLHPEVPLCFLLWDLMMWLALVNKILRDMTQAEVWNMCVQCIFLFMCL